MGVDTVLVVAMVLKKNERTKRMKEEERRLGTSS